MRPDFMDLTDFMGVKGGIFGAIRFFWGDMALRMVKYIHLVQWNWPPYGKSQKHLPQIEDDRHRSSWILLAS